MTHEEGADYKTYKTNTKMALKQCYGETISPAVMKNYLGRGGKHFPWGTPEDTQHGSTVDYYCQCIALLMRGSV